MKIRKHQDLESEFDMPQPALRRMPVYYGYLKQRQEQGVTVISSSTIAEDLNLHPVQVRKDMALTRVVGKPRTGFNVSELINELARLLDYNNLKNAVVVGAGHLGVALINYKGFQGYGLNLMAAFDHDSAKVGKNVGKLVVSPMSELPQVIHDNKIQIAVITVPQEQAQAVCDQLVAAGIRAIWNFAPIHLHAPEAILIQNENIAASLSVLSKRLQDKELREGLRDQAPEA
ncbi:MAG: redox-sensing transcriptional repressor Rex [Oscillospiraceae bacterium]|nr:redox-sensing transcriptional repressor Rex [Oscillospiraceae bacterium]